ncbi:MAG: crossover junction endodeoxyribonuclease RuvC [Spirochaetales bacterium]|jgi:Holliday junction resolvasome RuvABC endonuclease subunit|nr:crossover junction endodeoxyribonuclease RuvC [Spirochaetales bacterium]
MILAFDLATNTGWAVVANGKVLESGIQSFAKKRGETNGIMFLKFRRWANKLMWKMRTIKSYDIQIMAYEQAHFRGGAATEICVGLQTRVQELAAESQLESFPVNTASLKKFATGKGNASKKEVMEAAKKILKREPESDDEADAIFVGLYASQELGI